MPNTNASFSPRMRSDELKEQIGKLERLEHRTPVLPTLDGFDAETNKYEKNRWLKTRTSENRKPEVMADGKLKVKIDLKTPFKTGEHDLRIRAWGEKHDKPVYVAGGIIHVVEEE